MLSNVYLGIMLIPNNNNRVKIEKINLEGKVKQLTEHASKITNRPEEELELVYGGSTLQEDCTLSSYDVKSGKTIFVKERMLPLTPKSPPTPRAISESLDELSEIEFQQKCEIFVYDLLNDPVTVSEDINKALVTDENGNYLQKYNPDLLNEDAPKKKRNRNRRCRRKKKFEHQLNQISSDMEMGVDAWSSGNKNKCQCCSSNSLRRKTQCACLSPK